MKLPKRPMYVLAIFSLIVILTGVAQAKTESINVEPGKEFTRTIDLAAGDRTSIIFTVLGPAPSKLHFYMVLPNGTTSDYEEVSQCATAFSTSSKGTCQLHFNNSASSDSQLLTLDYSVEHYIFGVPQMIFILGAIAVLLMFAVSGYIIMGKYG